MKPVAVLVTYHPEIRLLDTNIAALVPQVAGLVLVDNGSSDRASIEAMLARQPLPYRTLFQPGNLGLAQAQNIGIETARTMGAETVLLMDQDSRAAPGMVGALTAGLQARRTDRPAAIGAAFDDPARGTGANLPSGGGDTPEMETLIASGTLIPLSAWDAVGPFDESLFIDFVDTEWCFRARALGLRCFAARRAKMSHRIGGDPLHLLGRNRSVHTPVRMYYQLRNLLLLARRPATPRLWLFRMLPRYLARSLVLSLTIPPRMARLRAVARGLHDGVRGRSGPA